MTTYHWKTATLADVCIRIGDGSHYSPQSVEEGLPMASVKDMTPFGINLYSCRKISSDDFEKLVRQGCQPKVGDVLIAKDGATALDTVCEVKKPLKAVLLSSIAILRPDRDKVTTQYLRYYLDAEPTREYMKAAFTTGAAIPRVVLKDFKRAQVRYPEISLQRKITSILSAYDNLNENNLRRIKILEEITQNLYREWFVKFRFPGHQKGKMVESSMGKIPEGWDEVRVEDLYQTASGGTPSRKVPEYFDGAINWAKTQELRDCFIFETEEKISEKGLRNSSAKIFPENTVLVAMYGATIGQLAILARQSTTNQACCALIKKNPCFGHSFAFLTLKERRADLIKLRQGAAQQNVNQVVIKGFKIIKPKADVVSEFNSIADPMLDLIKNLQRRNFILRQTRDFLLPKLISGEVDVSELDITIPEANA